MVTHENYANKESDANSNSSSSLSGGNNEQIMAANESNINNSSSSRNILTEETTTATLITPTTTTISSSSSSNIGENSGNGVGNENHNKLILKLPKNQMVSSMNRHSDDYDDDDVEDANEHERATRGSGGNHKRRKNLIEDTRKVEPLKINLLQHSSATSPMATIATAPLILEQQQQQQQAQQPHVPKITIKPIFKENTTCEAAISSDCSSSAEESELRLNRHHHNHNATPSSCESSVDSSSSPNSPHEQPHILPKLTIRSTNNEDGSTIVPKLTIKMNDNANTTPLMTTTTHVAAAAATTSTPIVSTTTSTTSPTITKTLSPLAPPPLPKLTIKTTQDGSCGSIISTPSMSSVGATPANILASPSIASILNSCNSAMVSTTNTVPKITIKTSASGGACVSSTENLNNNNNNENEKIPKLTIKTGQEHAMIITQHTNNDVSSTQQSIPKLTIKTKLYQKGNNGESTTNIVDITNDDDDEDEDDNNDVVLVNQQHHEKIPKLTIKTTKTTNETITQMTSPKSPQPTPQQQQQLIVRNVHQHGESSSPDRVPKLMISRTQDTMMVNNNNTNHNQQHTYHHQHKTNNSTSPNVTSNNNSKTTNSLLNMVIMEDNSNMEKVPKLTIKNINSKTMQHQSQQQILVSATSTTCDESNNSESLMNHYNNKTIPKLTIKNLCSPKLKMKAVLEDNCNVNITSESNNVGTNGNDNIQVKKTQQQQQQIDSDDMDIDEELTPIATSSGNNQNSTKINHKNLFNNLTTTITTTPQTTTSTTSSGMNLAVRRVIDTVDLTSSPDGSPAHTNYLQNRDESPKKGKNTAAPLLLERLQREHSVIQATSSTTANPHQQQQQTTHDNSSFLIHQLTAPLGTTASNNINNTKNSSSESSNKRLELPKLHEKLLQQQQQQLANKKAKYPHLTERLLANGIHTTSTASTSNNTNNSNVISSSSSSNKLKPETVIDSIEILDTPDGSSRSSIDETESLVDRNVQLNNGRLSPMQIFNYVKSRKSKMLDESLIDISPHKLRRVEHNSTTNKSQTAINPLMSPEKSKYSIVNAMREETTTLMSSTNKLNSNTSNTPNHHRSRKQKHEHLLTMPTDEEDPLQLHDHHDQLDVTLTPMRKLNNCHNKSEGNINLKTTTTPTGTNTGKKRGRPKKIQNIMAFESVDTNAHPNTEDNVPSSKTRRVQLLRKRLAIDMVTGEQPFANLDVDSTSTPKVSVSSKDDEFALDTPRRERPLRTPVRISRNNSNSNLSATPTPGKRGRRAGTTNKLIKMTSAKGRTNDEVSDLQHQNHFGGSNSSLSSASSSSSFSSTTLTKTTAIANTTSSTTTTIQPQTTGLGGQIDLTMSSSSSINSYGQQTTTSPLKSNATSNNNNNNNNNNNTNNNNNNSMLPPSKILSSSDRVPDVIFKPNDFSSILVTQQLRANASATHGYDDEYFDEGTCSDNSADSGSVSSSSARGRGRGRGRGSRGGSVGRGGAGVHSGRGSRGKRGGRGGNSAAKALAMARPRCVGGLKHTPDPKRLKGLYSPSPQVFEEDTRMSADLTQIQHQQQQNNMDSLPTTDLSSVVRQLDFFNNDESQSSIMSNTSMLDPNALAAAGGLAASIKQQRPKKKKMEVCVAEDTECTVGSIAEYDWPPPKGCCPSRHRDTFMIQEQVALYLGIKSFKRKYPDLPRRQIDMEERNWLQEKGLVSEKMCDLGITSVWASDILDIMYADFYEKYEEYKDYVRQKHLREIEVKQKALGISILGNARGMQIRERALLSASKFNSYFTRVRRSERVACLDLQSLTVSVPAPASAPASTILNRHMAQIITDVVAAENLEKPPTLMPPRIINITPQVEKSYPLALIPGQFTEHYRQFTPRELSCLPLQTALADVCKLREPCDADNEDETVVTRKSTHVRHKRHLRRINKNATTTSCVASDSEDSEASCHSTSSLPAKKQRIESHLNASIASVTTTASSSSSSDSERTSSASASSSSSSCTSSSSDEEKESLHKCGVCLRSQNNNIKQLPELFIKCYTCTRKVHPSCIELPHRMVARVRNYNWQCADCKCCIKCKRRQDANKMLFCEQCDRGYHIYCLDLKTVPDGRWSCERCSTCMRCGSKKPEGLPPQQSANGSERTVKQIKHKKVKWINEYRIDHITKLREHCSMLCVQCARSKTTTGTSTKRLQMASPHTAATTTTSTATTTSTTNNNSNNNNNVAITKTPMLVTSKIKSEENIINNNTNNKNRNNMMKCTTSTQKLILPRAVNANDIQQQNHNNSVKKMTAGKTATAPTTNVANNNYTPTTNVIIKPKPQQQQQQHQPLHNKAIQRIQYSNSQQQSQPQQHKLPTKQNTNKITTTPQRLASTISKNAAAAPTTSSTNNNNKNTGGSANSDISLAGATTLPPPPVVA